MQELIKVATDAQGVQVVSARELYSYLEIQTPFRLWIDRMFEYEFEENKDYTPYFFVHPQNKQQTIDYALTLDTAKEIAMLQRSEKGKQARQYFIDCEKKLRQQVQPLTQAEIILQLAQENVAQEKRLSAVEQVVQELQSVRQGALAQMAALPTSDEIPPEETLRAKVIRLVNAYCRSKAISQQETWNYIYERMYYLYRVSIKSYKKERPNETWLEVAERNGHVEKMFVIISDLVKKSA